MFKVMIVDDDELVRERIAKAVPLDLLGLQICAEAEDGEQALELFSRHRPQIVIMDINIPFLNGIDTAKQMLRENPETNIVIITGFGTVESAKEAIRSGMVDFLLKPINVRELEDALRRIVDKLEKHLQETLERQRIERLIQQGMPLVRNKYFLSLMQTPPEAVTEAEVRQYLEDFKIDKQASRICVAILLPTYNDLRVDQQMANLAILEEEISELLEHDGIGSVILYDSMSRLLLITYSTRKDLASTLILRLSTFRDKMRYLYRIDFRASVGSLVEGFQYLQESYKSAEEALCYWAVAADNNIVSSDSISNLDLKVNRLPLLRYADIMTLLASEDDRQLRDTIDQYMKDLSLKTHNSVYVMQQRAVELVSLLILCAREQGTDDDKLMNEKPPMFARFYHTSSVHEIMKLVQKYAAMVLDSVRAQRENNKNRIFASAKRYILQNYADPELSLVSVAEHVQLTPSYVSYLFKRTGDHTFTEFLNHTRIEQATKLLSTTHMRAYEIAYAVGYKNPKYFFQMFKQITGMTPKGYYSSIQEEDVDSQG